MVTRRKGRASSQTIRKNYTMRQISWSGRSSRTS